MRLATFEVDNHRPFFLIAGPCVIESEALVMRVAERLKEITSRLGIHYVFKASFDKANRTSQSSYRGPGLAEGLRVLAKVRDAFVLPVLTDVHEDTPIDEVADVVDVLQTPAFLVRQTNFIQRVARAQKPMNIKKGQFQAPWDMAQVVDKCHAAGNDQIMLCERGVSFGYNTLISDMRGLAVMRGTGCPVVFDATHSVQQPGGMGASSGGQSQFVPVLARAAIAAGVAGVFMETHPDPIERAQRRPQHVAVVAHGIAPRDAAAHRPGGEGPAIRGRRAVVVSAGGREFCVVIPARYASTRLPGKPLRLLAGKPLLQHAFERASESGASRVLIAADDARIVDAARGFGAEVLLTSSEHPNGTCRLAEVAERLGFADEQCVVNLQGDEPQIPGTLIDQVAEALLARPSAHLATLASPIRKVDELFSPHVVKVVLRNDGSALYFSRAPIPWARDAFAGGAPDTLPSEVPYLRHIGLYGYRAGVLKALAKAPAVASEEAESLEQLRALALGLTVHVALCHEVPGHGVDTEADLRAVEALLAGKGGE